MNVTTNIRTRAVLSPPLIAGEEYVAAISRNSSDRRARAAFLARAVEGLAPGATIFDFGCGPGLDAEFYASRDFQVRAYDVDACMCDAFERRCAAALARGDVQLMRGGYRAFLDSKFAHAESQLVVANFAPLNVIADLPEIFAKFHALTRPGARLLASLLNPTCVYDMRFGWWWRHRIEYWRLGSYALPGPGYQLRRYSPARLAALAQPWFELRGVYRGLPHGPMSAAAWLTPLMRCASQFLFFEFARR